jgi:hypothetical protein
MSKKIMFLHLSDLHIRLDSDLPRDFRASDNLRI